MPIDYDSIVQKYKEHPEQYWWDMRQQRETHTFSAREYTTWVTRLNQLRDVPGTSETTKTLITTMIEDLTGLFTQIQRDLTNFPTPIYPDVVSSSSSSDDETALNSAS